MFPLPHLLPDHETDEPILLFDGAAANILSFANRGGPLSDFRLTLFFCSTAPQSFFRPDRRHVWPSRAAGVKDGRFLQPPEGLVLDGREHDGSLVSIGARKRLSRRRGLTRAVSCDRSGRQDDA
jgi:hypothetical protein